MQRPMSGSKPCSQRQNLHITFSFTISMNALDTVKVKIDSVTQIKVNLNFVISLKKKVIPAKLHSPD